MKGRNNTNLMSFFTILFIAMGLAMDAFAVSIAASVCLRNVSKRQIFRLSFHTGLFQFLMPVIGWYSGSAFSKYISSYDHWVAFIVLSVIGLKMIRESFEEKKCENTIYEKFESDIGVKSDVEDKAGLKTLSSDDDSCNVEFPECSCELKQKVKDPTSGFTLFFIAIATSIDALAVGVSLAFLNVNIWYPAVIIGIVTMIMSIIGMKIGEKIGPEFGGRMELAGGLMLIVIGCKIVLEHTGIFN